MSRGYRIVGRKFRVREAEIDLVARDPDGTLVFVEVRTRRGGAAGMAALSVNRSKARKVLLALQWYVEAHPEAASEAQRVDVVAIELERDGAVRSLEHIEDAVRPDRV